MADKMLKGSHKETGSRRDRKRKMPDPTRPNFYAIALTAEERADLALITGDHLDDEIALLKILIRRKLKSQMEQRNGRQDDQGEGQLGADDNEVIRRYVDTLCRAIKIRHSLSGKGSPNVEELVHGVLAEVVDELGITIQTSDPTKEGVTTDGIKQSDCRPDAEGCA